MKLSEFIVLNQEEKRFAVLHEGVPVAQRQLSDYMIFLFRLPGYFVETYCSKDTKAVQEYRVFHNPAHLPPYLDGLSIEELMNR